jgi:hypothetical protein
MRYVNIILALLMALFAFVQLNDPDAVLWFFIYMVPAILAAVAAFRPHVLATAGGTVLCGVLMLLSFAGVAYYWPTTPGFWRQEVWWETETAREGMGVMILAIVMIVIFYTAWSARGRASVPDQA